MSKYDELKKLAEAATPGPWSYDGSYICPARVEDETTYVETWCAVADSHQTENVRFIAAANPAVILDLIDEVEALRQDAARWKFVRSPLGTSSPFAVWHEGKMPVFSSIADRMVDDAMAREVSK